LVDANPNKRPTIKDIHDKINNLINSNENKQPFGTFEKQLFEIFGYILTDLVKIFKSPKFVTLKIITPEEFENHMKLSKNYAMFDVYGLILKPETDE
ncbi:16867_t:CDS:2, partial [Racocetra fulgida]